MIPPVHQAVHQGVHILALGQRSSAGAAPDAAGFLAALAVEQGSTSAADAALNADTSLSAEACLAAGLVVPALPLLNAPPPAPIPPPTERISAEPAAATTPAAPMALPTGQLLALPQDAPPQTETAGASASAHPSQVERLLADDASPLISPREIPPVAHLADLVAPLAAQAPAPPDTVPAAATLASHAASPDMMPQNPLQSAKPAANASPVTMLHAFHHPKADAPLPDAPQPLPSHARQDHMAAQQDLPAQPQPLPAQSLPEHILRAQNQNTDAAAVSQAPKTRVSPAESAWQTRLQHATPPQSEPVPAPTGILVDATGSTPPNSAASTATGSEDTVSIDKKLPAPLASLVPTAQILPSDPPADPAFPQDAADQPRATPASAPHRPDLATRDTPTPASATATPPDQTMPQPVADPARPQVNPAPVQPIQPHPAAQTAPPLPPLAVAVPAQLLPHHAAAKTGGVDVLLQPEELGHVKFHIQQHGETVRILLSAERPETLDLLRRHSDQLLQEFRQSGFSQATLDFGQWGQQQRSSPPPAELTAPFDADTAEPASTPRPAAPTPAAASGQGLNLRL